MKPFIKWAGGKRQLLGRLKEYFDKELKEPGAKYFEPFVGGGAVLFDLKIKNSVINDFNSELVNTYKIVRDHPEELIQLLEIHKKNHNKEYFYKVRSQDRSKGFSSITDIAKAARTIYLNKTCFNGLYRVNLDGFFNTPIGNYINPQIYSKENIYDVSSFLRENNIVILNTDFEEAVPNPRKGDFIYFDPPYDYENEKGFVNYNSGGFDRDDLSRLKVFCDKLINLGCNVLISNNDTTFVRELFNDKNYEYSYTIKDFPANRSINSNSQLRSKSVVEVLIYGTKKI